MNELKKAFLIGFFILFMIIVFSLIILIFKKYGINLDIKILLLITILHFSIKSNLKFK